MKFVPVAFRLRSLLAGFLVLMHTLPGRAAEASRPDAARALLIPEQATLRYREGLRQVLAHVAASPDLFPAQPVTETRLLNREQREAVWTTWKTLLDYLIALDGLSAAHAGFWQQPRATREQSFLLANAAHAADYRFALEFLHRADNDPSFRALLNDPVPELGLPMGTYDRLKLRFLHVARAGEFAAWESARPAFGGDGASELRRAIEADSAAIWQFGEGRGPQLTVKNGLQILKNTGHQAWFPVQKGVSAFLGDTKVQRRGVTLISKAQIAVLKQRLEPGDLLLCRSEWYLSNVGLPGFWPHAALYLGTPAQRGRYFDGDPGSSAGVHDQGSSGHGNAEHSVNSPVGKLRPPSLPAVPAG